MTQCPSKKKRISWKEKTEKQQKTNNCQHSASNIMTEQHERRQKNWGGGNLLCTLPQGTIVSIAYLLASILY